MSKIKFRLARDKNVIYFQVLSMDERFRCTRGWTGKMYSPKSLRITIRSVNSPQLNYDSYTRFIDIFLRGSLKEHDFDVVSLACAGVEGAKKTMEDIKAALKEWAENWSGWEK